MWSKINKQYVVELVEAGLMTDAGMRAVDIAKDNGAWSLLEPVDALIIPDDLESALRNSARAREAYDALSDTNKRSVLYSLYSAKREDTRSNRLARALAELEGRSLG